MRKFNTMKFGLRIWLTVPLVMVSLLIKGQQVIGSYPNMNGGFEGLTNGSNITSTTSSTSAWWVQTNGNPIITVTTGSGARSGNTYINAVQTGTSAKQIKSPVATSNQPAGNYTVQFYYKGDKDLNPDVTNGNMRGALFQGTDTKYQGWLSPNTSSYIKNVFTVAISSIASPSLYASLFMNNACNFDFDDFVIYAGSEDIIAPDPATSLSFTPASTQIALSWTAPASVDGGGYLVIRYTEDPTPTSQPNPNVNGIYAQTNSIGNGIVAYIGTNPGFTDTGLEHTKPYYYRVYTVDKAFNYSTVLSGNSATREAGLATEPTAQVTGLNFTSVTSSGMTINWTSAVSGGGTNHLVVVKAGSDLTSDPTDASSNNSSTVLGSGTSIGGGSVVYNSTGNSVSITGLSALTTYYVRVYDFNGSGGTENYYTTSPASGSQITNRKTITSAQDGSFKTASTWQGGVIPTAEDNAVVAHNVEVTGSNGGSCYNLTINSGGRLFGNNTAYNAALLNVYGTTVQVDGTIDAAAGATEPNQTSIQFYQNCTISGSGTIKINRLKPGTNVTNSTFTFNANADIVNTSYCFIYDNSGNSNIGYTINSGKTVNMSGQVLSSATASLTVNGTLNMLSGSLGDFSANNYCTGTGTFNLNSGATMKIASTNGLNASTGPIRCSTRNYNSGASFQFIGSSAQVTGSDFPSTISNLIINNAAGVNLSSSLTTSGTTTITAGTLQTSSTFTANGSVSVAANGAFQLNAGGWATGIGIWTYASGGTLIFNNTSSYGVGNSDVFWPAASGPTNVTIMQGGLTLNSANRTVSGNFITASGVTLNSSTLTLNGTTQINAGGYFNQAPTYGAASTLKYNTGETYGRGAEWSSTNPANLTLSNNTTLNYPNGSGVASRSLTGNLTIDAGSSLYMDYGSPGQSGSLTFGGNASINGNLSLGDASGGDLYVGGNWTRAATGSTFNTNSRAVFFNGSGVQTITNTGGENFSYLFVQNTGSGVTFANNVTTTQTEIAAGSKVTNSATFTATTLHLRSTTSGTATYIENGTSNITTANVEQYLGTVRNWYVASPVASTTSTTANMSKYFEYIEAGNNTDYLTQPSGSSLFWKGYNPGHTMTAGKGYIALPATTGATLTFSGALNSGDVNVAITSAGNRFNLIGNPYPCHIAWTGAFAANKSAQIEPSIYIRTNSGSSNSGGWSFATYNASNGLAVPNHSLLTGGIIPPMQAFWVRAVASAASPLVLNSDLTRSHQSSNPLKAPAINNTDRQMIRLEVSNGVRTDETLLLFDTNAADGYDVYDSPKYMEANSEVQIFTTVDSQKLVMNGMKNLPLNQEISLGFIPGNASSFSLRANEITNLPPDVKLILKDNASMIETDLSDGISTYTFGPATYNGDRFSILFRTPEGTTATTNPEKEQISVYVNAQNELVINACAGNKYAIYNALGQQIATGKTTSNFQTSNFKLMNGVYVVKVGNTSNRIIVK